jgi:hypothetical protein
MDAGALPFAPVAGGADGASTDGGTGPVDAVTGDAPAATPATTALITSTVAHTSAIVRSGIGTCRRPAGSADIVAHVLELSNAPIC